MAFAFTSLSTAYTLLVSDPRPYTTAIRKLYFCIVLPTPFESPEKVEDPWIKAGLWFAILDALRKLPNLRHLITWFDALDYKYCNCILQKSRLLDAFWKQPLTASVKISVPADQEHPIDQEVARNLQDAGVEVVERGYPTFFINSLYPNHGISAKP